MESWWVFGLVCMLIVGAVAGPSAAMQPGDSDLEAPPNMTPNSGQDVEAPDYERDDLREALLFDFRAHEDGTVDVAVLVVYTDVEGNLDSPSEFPYQDDEAAYRAFEQGINDTMSALVAASEDETGRDMHLVRTRTTESVGERSVQYSFEFEVENLAAVRDDAVVLTEPLASNHTVLASQADGVVVRGPRTPGSLGAQLDPNEVYHVAEVSGEITWELEGSLVAVGEQYSNYYERVSLDVPGDLEAFRVVFQPLTVPPRTTTATSTPRPTSEPVTTQPNTDPPVATATSRESTHAATETAAHTGSTGRTWSRSSQLFVGLNLAAILLLAVIGGRSFLRSDE